MMPYFFIYFFTILSQNPTFLGDNAHTGLPVHKIETTSLSAEQLSLDHYVTNVYDKLELRRKGVKQKVFQNAMVAYFNLKMNDELSDKDIITIIDMEKPSTEKRMWVVDLKNEKVLFHTYAAHGQGTGEKYAKNFSNIPESFMSSLGMYVTDTTYFGKHGLSLFLNGKEEGFNDKARERSIVMHGADYVNSDFIQKVGRLGRSHGCPAVPMHLHKQIINTIAGGTALFVSFPDKNYLSQSKMLNKQLAADFFTQSKLAMFDSEIEQDNYNL